MPDKLLMTSVADLLWTDEEEWVRPIDDKPALRLDCAGGGVSPNPIPSTISVGAFCAV